MRRSGSRTTMLASTPTTVRSSTAATSGSAEVRAHGRVVSEHRYQDRSDRSPRRLPQSLRYPKRGCFLTRVRPAKHEPTALVVHGCDVVQHESATPLLPR